MFYKVRLVLRATLDRESASEHHVRVTAYDADELEPRSGDLEVTVVVLDSNDNSPVFEYSAYEVRFISTNVYCVHALSTCWNDYRDHARSRACARACVRT